MHLLPHNFLEFNENEDLTGFENYMIHKKLNCICLDLDYKNNFLKNLTTFDVQTVLAIEISFSQ